MSVPYEKIVAEDLNTGVGAVDVTMPAGGTASGQKINPATFGALGFAATAPGNQSLAASTLSTVELNTEEFDTQGWFNNGSYTFTPLKAGYYQIIGTVALAAFTGTLTVGIYKNGVLVDSVLITATAEVVKIQVMVHVVANGTTDAFTLKAIHTDTSARVISAGRMSGACVGGL